MAPCPDCGRPIADNASSDAEPPGGWPRTWPMTVADAVVPPGEEPNADGHIRRVTPWAKAIRETLDALAVPADAQLE